MTLQDRMTPPPDGWYWVRLYEGASWQPAWISLGEAWIIGAEESFGEVFEVGVRIAPPADP